MTSEIQLIKALRDSQWERLRKAAAQTEHLKGPVRNKSFFWTMRGTAISVVSRLVALSASRSADEWEALRSAVRVVDGNLENPGQL